MNRYKTIKRSNTDQGREYINNAVYPDIPLSENDSYVITQDGDRYDTLAKYFYNDQTLWWIIASANNSTRDSLFIEPGVQLRIPASKDRAVDLFETLNANR